MADVLEEVGRMTLGDKNVVECGDGDSATLNVGSESGRSGDNSQVGVQLQATNGNGFNGDTLASHPHHHYNDKEALELFKMTVCKKKYSTDPVPLNSPWTFWVNRTERGVDVQQFESNLNRIYTVYTVRHFWWVYCNIPKPNDLGCRSSLHMMRDKRKPVWEESYNAKGGTFKFVVNKKDAEKVWKEILLAAIGEQLNEYVSPKDEVCGVTVSIRDREDVILVWNTNAEAASQAKIFDCVRLLLPDTNFLSTSYKPHETHHAFEKSRPGVGYKGASGLHSFNNSSKLNHQN